MENRAKLRAMKNFNKFGVRKIAGSKPEEFVIFLYDTNHSQPGPFMSEIAVGKEKRIRAELKKMVTPARIEELLEKARKTPA